MKIAVAGTGYVGLSLAVLLSQHNEVTAVILGTDTGKVTDVVTEGNKRHASDRCLPDKLQAFISRIGIVTVFSVWTDDQIAVNSR